MIVNAQPCKTPVTHCPAKMEVKQRKQGAVGTVILQLGLYCQRSQHAELVELDDETLLEWPCHGFLPLLDKYCEKCVHMKSYCCSVCNYFFYFSLSWNLPLQTSYLYICLFSDHFLMGNSVLFFKLDLIFLALLCLFYSP